ncbi:S-methyl-5-thioribose-1-phosphate isomerase [Rhodohalobacter sp. SW132]|uniref:S-methyl-5-thioribose-1-phosphate isomerase n=1 Tax=Rhodohalobacter sp. SW132 TaxID=2293433 RepID=UPI000E25718E|nr:S-methyl-5-thioribose-1-phosphate isomerase [Rhodohalobacter sp. SW132]REL33031.1 S-methyl-5-thioribose-1-phosphate isomerase [Rhodohalobacter sp. SW132]
MSSSENVFESIRWDGESLVIIDQTKLPGEENYLELKTAEDVRNAIRRLSVRGAPAIGISGAYGFYLGIKDLETEIDNQFLKACRRVADSLNSARPTAVNLSWALNKLMDQVERGVRDGQNTDEIKKSVLADAVQIHDEDRELCRSIGEKGLQLFDQPKRVLTHCNTGGLATGQFGTALSCITHAHNAGNINQVWVDETRPLLQGARLTTWELRKAGVPHSLIVDSAAGFLMQRGEVDLVILGADRISRNGDTANKIGTYTLAVLAKENGIPFYVAAPYSTFDLSLASGDDIEIELRDEEEVTALNGHPISPGQTSAYNPAFDITPHRYISGIITERGIIYPDFEKNVVRMMNRAPA